MEGLQWIGEHWFDLLQTVGIVGGLFFTAYTTRKDDRSRKIANLIAIKQQYREIWKELYDRPQLGRVLEKAVEHLRSLFPESLCPAADFQLHFQRPLLE